MSNGCNRGGAVLGVIGPFGRIISIVKFWNSESDKERVSGVRVFLMLFVIHEDAHQCLDLAM